MKKQHHQGLFGHVVILDFIPMVLGCLNQRYSQFNHNQTSYHKLLHRDHAPPMGSRSSRDSINTQFTIFNRDSSPSTNDLERYHNYTDNTVFINSTKHTKLADWKPRLVGRLVSNMLKLGLHFRL